jgi:hypothetical protein
MKRVVMTMAVEIDGVLAECDRAADAASRTIRTWTRDDPSSSQRVVLLSARWEADDDPLTTGPTGRVSGV